MNVKNVVIVFVISVIVVMCKRTNETEEHFFNFMEQYEIEIGNEDDLIFYVFFENGCSACNDIARREILKSDSEDSYLIYVGANLKRNDIDDSFKGKFRDKLILDKKEFMKRIPWDLKGSGKIIVTGEKIKRIEMYEPGKTGAKCAT